MVADPHVGELSTSPQVAHQMAANKGDLVYISDARTWLGGLPSTHAKLSAFHDKDARVVFVSPSLIKRGNLLLQRKHRIEKII